MRTFTNPPIIYIISRNKTSNSTVKCDKVSTNSSGFFYEDCKILTSGDNFIIIQNLGYYQNSLKISSKISKIITDVNKTQVFINELLEIKPIIINEDNSTVTQDTIIELLNYEMIGLKKIVCRYKKCSLLVSCVSLGNFELVYKIHLPEYQSQNFTSIVFNCTNPKDDYLSFNQILVLVSFI